MAHTNPDPDALKIPDEKGAPENRIKNAFQVWEICKDLEDQDKKRSLKRGRIFKAYNRFPPKEYSTLFKQGLDWQSNVNFGMMAYIVDNNHSSFFDMLTERSSAADIKTKFGQPRDRRKWGDLISVAFDRVLRAWDDFLLNQEQTVLDMLLFSKGIEMWDDKEGCTSEHVSADDFLVPDGTKVSLCNFDVLAIKRRYSLHELWDKIESSGGESKWNRKAVLSAMRYQRQAWKTKYDDEEQFSKAIAAGDVTLAGHLKEQVDCYILFIKEFKSKKISKYIVLRDYGPALSLTRKGGGQGGKSEADKKKDVINREGFLFEETDYADEIQDIFAPFMESAGSGMWHNVTSLGEKIFVQCRQYDFTMNAIMDAVKINMSLMLQAQTAEASEKIKALVFGPSMIIPSDIPFVQQRIALPTQEATQTLQFMMLDMFRGIGEYRISDRASGGQAVTATQNQNDTAEAAKLSGTQLKRFNGQHTLYYRRFYKKLVGLKQGEKDYHLYEIFKDFLLDQGVPKEAWQWKNIESINSNLLAGAGSPSYKLMAAEKTIALTNVAPKDEGQAHAVDDALAALHGRDNVRRYRNATEPEPTFNEQKAGWENELLGNPLANPADVKVMPDDNHVFHVAAHLGDMERCIALVNENMKNQKLTPFVAESAAHRLLHQGAHVMGHFEFLARDEAKEPMLKEASARLEEIQRAADEMAKQMKALQEQQTKDYDPTTDPKVAQQIAIDQIKLNTAQRLADIQANKTATSHAQKMEINQDKAANDIAMDRAKTLSKIESEKLANQSKQAESPSKPK